jgi:hypothetical protein
MLVPQQQPPAVQFFAAPHRHALMPQRVAKQFEAPVELDEALVVAAEHQQHLRPVPVRMRKLRHQCNSGLELEQRLLQPVPLEVLHPSRHDLSHHLGDDLLGRRQ